MGFEKLNPFKKSQKSSLSPPEDDLKPTKSTSSVAQSIRSFGDKAEEFMSKGQKPRQLYETKDGHYDPNTLPIALTTAGGGVGGIGGGLAPAMSNGGGLPAALLLHATEHTVHDYDYDYNYNYNSNSEHHAEHHAEHERRSHHMLSRQELPQPRPKYRRPAYVPSPHASVVSLGGGRDKGGGSRTPNTHGISTWGVVLSA